MARIIFRVLSFIISNSIYFHFQTAGPVIIKDAEYFNHGFVAAVVLLRDKVSVGKDFHQMSSDGESKAGASSAGHNQF